MDDTFDDEEPRYLSRFGPMFSRGTVNRGELATDLAIEILADGGWSALTLRNVARAANVTPQAIAAWFPSVAAMRVSVATRYGDRWIRERAQLARQRRFCAPPNGFDQADLLAALLPQTWHEELFDGVWLTIVEAGRWDEAIGSVVASVQAREEDLVRELLRLSTGPGREVDRREVDRCEVERCEVERVLAIVRGIRAAHVHARTGRTAEHARAMLRTDDAQAQAQMAAGIPSEKTSGVAGNDSASPRE